MSINTGIGCLFSDVVGPIKHKAVQTTNAAFVYVLLRVLKLKEIINRIIPFPINQCLFKNVVDIIHHSYPIL